VVLLLFVLAVAAGLRFRALDWGLRDTPHIDERYFVDNVARMLRSGSLDHGYYEYPALLFFLLLPVIGLASSAPHDGPDAYLAARAAVAACGVLAVALTLAFGRRLLASSEGGATRERLGAWAAAGLVAVSPLGVETAHMLRADVPLQALLLLVCLACLRVGARVRDDLRTGLALGLATGLKFSGALALMTYVAQRLLAAGPRARGLLAAGTVGAAVFLGGVDAQLSYHYERAPETVAPFAHRLAAYAEAWPHALGWPAAALALIGLVLALRSAPRVWLPFVLLPPATALVFAGTDFVFARHLLPSLPLVALLAGLALDRLHERRPRLTLVLGALALLAPLRASLLFLDQIDRPSTRERAAAWLATHGPRAGHVVTTLPSLRLDPARFEVQRLERLDPLQVAQADAVVSVAEEERSQALDGWRADVALRPTGPYDGLQLFVRVVAGERSAREQRVELSDARLRVSSSPETAERLRDGRLETAWRLSANNARGAWIVLSWPEARRVSRLELLLGEPAAPALTLRLLGSEDGEKWQPVATLPGRGAFESQVAAVAPLSEVRLFAPRSVRALRLERRAGARPWAVAELRAWGPAVSAGP
jgi:hypothetical protein